MLPKSIEEDPRYCGRLSAIETPNDVPAEWKGTPIEKFILSENFGREVITDRSQPELLIATCIEFRYALPVPRMFAYVIRRASGRLVGSEFSLAYIFSRGVKHIALVGHNDCGMTKVDDNKKAMTDALIEQGWHRDRATEFINMQASRYEMKDEIEALQTEYKRIKRLFKHVVVAPLFVCLADTKLYIPNWYLSGEADKNADAEVPDEELIMLQ